MHKQAQLVALMVGCFLFGISAYAAKAKAVSNARIDVSSGCESAVASAQAQNSNRKVVGRGVGKTKIEALKDAYRDAVERAIGLYVDAETQVKNERIVRDDILTQSNAYIESYDEISSESDETGMIQVRILAVVKTRELTTRLTATMPAQSISIGDSLKQVHAQIITKRQSDADGSALLQKVLAEYDPVTQYVKPSVRVETQQVVKQGSARWVRGLQNGVPEGKVVLSYVFELRFDREKYFSEFMPALRRVFDQISIVPPKEFCVTGLQEDPYDGRLHCMQQYLKGGEARNTRADFEGRGGYGFYDELRMMAGSCGGVSWGWQGGPRYSSGGGGSFKGCHVDRDVGGWTCEMDSSYRDSVKQSYCWVLSSIGENCGVGKMIQYGLGRQTTKVLNDWIAQHSGLNYKTITYNVVLVAKGGEELAVFPWQVDCSALLNVSSTCLYSSYAPKGVRFSLDSGDGSPIGGFYFSPFVGCAGDSFIAWRDLVVDESILPRVESIKIEIAE